MPIDIKAPDGSVARFPDGTSDDVILSVMRREYGGPEEKPAATPTEPSQPEPSLMTRARDVFTGELRTEFPDAPEFLQAASRGTSVPLDVIQRSAITSDPKAQLDIIRSAVPNLESRTDRFGNLMLRAPGMSDFAYLNKPGASARDLDEFGTQLLATLPFGGLFGRGASLAGRAATGAAAGAGSSVTLDALATAAGSEQGIDAERAAVSAALGGVIGPLAGRPADPGTQSALQAAERIGVQVPRAVASDSTAVQMTGGALRNAPFIGTPIERAAKRTVAQLGEAAEGVARELGGGTAASPLSAGSAAKDALTDWIKRGYREVTEEGYKELDQLINHNTAVPLSRTQIAVRDLTNLDVMSASDDGKRVIGLVQEAVSRQGGLTYRGIKELRTRIGERLDGDIAPEQGTSARALRRIYGALTEDLKFAVQRSGIGKKGSSGKKALEAFERANAKAREIAHKRQSLKTIVGAEADAPAERVFDRLMQMASTRGNADLQKLIDAKKVIGEDWSQVSSALVARLGRDREGNFSAGRFLTAWGNISPDAKAVLFGQGGLKAALDDIAEVSSRFDATLTSFGNPSGTGRAVSAISGVAGAIASPMTTLATALGGTGLSFVLSRPITAKAAARWANLYLQNATRGTQATQLALQQASRQLVETINSAMEGEQ